MERRFKHRLLSLVLALVMTLTLLPMSAMATGSSTSPELDYRIVHLDCGRKYFSVDNIKSIIDTASAAGFNYLELAFGNDGLRFLLDDMSVTIEQTATADYSVDEQSAEEEPAEPETPVEEPAAEVEAPAEEPAAEEEATTEEPAAEVETPAEEPAAEDETSTEEPAAEPETPAEEPAAEAEATTGEPAAETEEPAAMPTSMTTTAVPASTTTKEYSSADVTAAIQNANKAYYDAGDKNELTQEEMDEIIDYANSKGMSIIPLFNTPGHMNAVVSAMAALGIDGDYNGSTNTIDVTDATAVAFTKALVQKYIDYFARKGCTVFNIGADEYANDIYSTGGMGFAQLVSAGQYDEFVAYVNELAAMVKNAGMKPMAFNDGIYYNSNTTTKIDTDILVAYWTCGWSGYDVASASFLSKEGFKLVNTNGDYYWVLGKTNAQCSADKASGFDVNTFIGGSTISAPAGAMFCIWCDVPGADTADNVVKNTAATITAFGGAIYTAPAVPDATVTANVDNATISVTAPGLESVTAYASTTEATIPGASEYKVYDITPATADGAYTGEATVTLPVPETWTNVRGGVLASDGKEAVMGITGALDTINHTFTFVVPHFSSVVVYDLGETQQETITITAGGTATATIEGVNLTGIEPVIGDNTVVTNVTVTGSDEQAAEPTVTVVTTPVEGDKYYIQTEEGTYLTANCDTTTDIANAGSWTYAPDTNWWGTTYHTFADANGNYLKWRSSGVYQSTSDNSSDGRFYLYDGTIYATYSWLDGYSDRVGELVTVTGTDATPASTTVTITTADDAAGKSTTVTVGSVEYTVNVTAVDLSTVTPITIEYWITNSTISTTSNGTVTSLSLTADMEGITSTDGLLISDLVPATGYRGTDGAHVYWRTRLLDRATDEQTSASGDNECMDGTGIVRVRYDIASQTWQVYTEAGEWVNVTDTTSIKQIVAYYMKTMDIKNATTGLTEVYAMSADWGAKADGTEQTYSDDNNQAATVSIQIVYEDGSTNPGTTEASDLKTYTFVYDHWNPRGLGTVGFVAANGYQIYKVSAETGDVLSTGNSQYLSNGYFNAGSFKWDGNEKTIWESENPLATAAVSNPTDTISFDEPLDNLTWHWDQHNDNNAILLRVYVRVVATEDTLNVHYIDNTTGAEFYDYSIAVKEGTLFNKQIGLENGAVINGSVTNYVGATQTVTADLSTMPQISAAYRERQYTCVSVVRSEEGKDVYLHYTFNDTHPVVYDYGLPITVTAENMEIDNVSIIELVSTPKYGTVTIDGTNVIYTPNTMSPQVEDVTLSCTYDASGDTQAATVKTILQMIPATTVYYEDNCGLISFSDGWSGSTTQTGTQAYNSTPYGYDAAYASSGNYSNGSAHTVTIRQGSDSQKATFTFTGTGFDIYSTSAPASGLMKVQVSNASGVVKTVSVQNTGVSTLYQVPVVSIEGLPHDTYDVTVTCYAAYEDSQYDALSRGGEHVIDAVVIYNPLATEGEQYRTDKEANAVRLEVRNAIIEAQDYNANGGEGVLYLNAAGDGSVEDYTLVGPDNEAYLSTGHAIAFTLETSAPVETLQIGAKSANGQSVTMSVTVNGVTTEKTISTATAMNYELGLPEGNTATSYDVYITNTGSGVLSITDVKATFASDATAAFTYSAANVDTPSAPAEQDAEISRVTITTSRVRYGRDMTIEVVTDKALVDSQSFSVKAGSRTYTVGGGSRYGLTVSEPVLNDDGTYTYTLTLKPYAYSLFGEITFTVTLSGTDDNTGTTGTASRRVYLL